MASGMTRVRKLFCHGGWNLCHRARETDRGLVIQIEHIFGEKRTQSDQGALENGLLLRHAFCAPDSTDKAREFLVRRYIVTSCAWRGEDMKPLEMAARFAAFAWSREKWRGHTMYHTIEFVEELSVDLEISPKYWLQRM